jgi:uncharacterized membrane protein
MPNPTATAATQHLSVSSPKPRAYRLEAIDMLRGLVILIMAIDHVRDYFLFGAEQEPMGNPHISAGLFATRWITHFCAPVFVALAGVSAGLMGAKKSRSELGTLLFTRGVWLVFAEVFIISTLTTFSPGGIAGAGGLIFVSMQVIWAIGASMILLSALQWLGRAACFATGIVLAAGHNLLDPIWPASTLLDQHWPVWVALHSQMSLHVGPFLLRFAYPLLPWTGVMALGYGVSGIFELPPARRDRVLLRAGTALTAAFLVLRAAGIYGDPHPWHGRAAGVMDFLNTTKYPPSLEYLLMTLGPAAILCSFADRITGVIKNYLVLFGRVPFAFYVAHLFLIHSLSVLLGVSQGFPLRQMMTNYRYYPKGYGIGLPWVYAVWGLVVCLLYPYCRWAAGMKAKHREHWLSYLA